MSDNTQQWIHEGDDGVEKTSVYRHADCSELKLRLFFPGDQVFIRVGFYVPYNARWVECAVFLAKRCHPAMSIDLNPNTDTFVHGRIDEKAEKVRAFLERFPKDSERVSQFCGICGTDINALPLATHNHPTPTQSALWSFLHFRDHHLGNSTVKSALKQA